MMEQGKDGARNPAGSPHFVLQLCFFCFFFVFYGGGDSSSRREVKERGIYRCQSTIHRELGIHCPGKSFRAVPVALVNETVAMSIAIRVETVTVAVAAPHILALKTGLLCPPYTNCVIIAS